MTEEEQQAAMALKLMDNVKQLIADTVAEDLRRRGLIYYCVDALIRSYLKDSDHYSELAKAVKRIVAEQMIVERY